MPAIHQLVAGFANGDAISNEAQVMRGIFRSWNVPSDIFCETRRVLPELRKEARDLGECAAAIGADDIALLHLSIGSDVNEVFRTLRCRKALLYHNVTPSHYFDMINRQTANCLEKGSRQVASLVNAAEVNMADSQFNADELVTLGYRNVHVLPLVLDLEKITSSPDRRIMNMYGDDKKTIIFVGRCAPNKKIEDAINAFYYFNRFVDSNSRFIHVGSFAGTERYHYLLLTQIRELDLNTIRFAGSVPQAQLNAYYECADLFLSMSEHEGFCIPIIESMAHDIPVLAYAATAVPETMDGAGVLFHDKRPEAVAEMMGHMTRDTGLRGAIIKKQQERLARYARRDLAAELKLILAPLLLR